MITALNHNAIVVRDMEESLHFYMDILGFRKAFQVFHEEDGSPWIEYLYIGNGQYFELFYGGQGTPSYDEYHTGFFHMSFETDDIYAFQKKLTDAGYKITHPMKIAHNNLVFWTEDPNGIPLEIEQIGPDSPQAAINAGSLDID